MMLKKIIPLIVCFLSGACFTALYVNWDDMGTAAAPNSANDYPVQVSVSALGNRTIAARVRGHTIISDQPREFGADDKGPTPPELLAASFGTCVIATMQLLAARENIAISDIKVDVAGKIDFTKALGQPGNNRAGFQGLVATIGFNSDMSDDEKQDFIERVSKIGAALDNIENKTPVKYVLQ